MKNILATKEMALKIVAWPWKNQHG